MIKKNWYWILGGLVVIMSIFAYFKKKNQKSGESVYVENVAKRTIQETVIASGKIYPQTEVKISSDVSGEIIRLYVKEGDTVTLGQPLLSIDADVYRSAVEQGEASLNATKANYANAQAQIENAKSQIFQAQSQLDQLVAQYDNVKATHDRNIELAKEGVISQSELESSLASLNSSEANVAAARASINAAKAGLKAAQESANSARFNVSGAQASLKELNTDLSRTTISAPMDGVVSSLSVEVGERVVGTIQMTGTEIMRVSDFSIMEAQVEVSETNILQVGLNNPVQVEIDAFPDKKFKGHVTEIANSAQNLSSQVALNSDQVTNFIVKVELDPTDYQSLIQPGKPFPLRPGLSCSVEIFTNEVEGTLSVPIMAVGTRELGKKKSSSDDDVAEVVYIVQGDTVEQRIVKTGIQDDDYIQVLEGVNDGETVVKAPFDAVAKELKMGTSVTVEEDGNNAQEDK